MALGPHRTAFVARELAPAGLRSSPKPSTAQRQAGCMQLIGAASRPSGSKLPRHGVSGKASGPQTPENPCGSRACPRWRQPIRHRCKLTHRLREQARSHMEWVVDTNLVSTRAPLWERACPRWRQPIQHRCKLTHRFREQARSHMELGGGHKPCIHPSPPVGASLLAKTAAHSTSLQTDPPPSRASSLPQNLVPSIPSK